MFEDSRREGAAADAGLISRGRERWRDEPIPPGFGREKPRQRNRCRGNHLS